MPASPAWQSDETRYLTRIGNREFGMDEPSASLDYGNQMRLLAHIRRLARQNLSIVLSTHNPDHAFLAADRVALLNGGSLTALGTPADVLTPETLKELYDIDVVVGALDGSARICAPRLDQFPA